MVDDVNDIQGACTKDKWVGLPAVFAKVYLMPPRGFSAVSGMSCLVSLK
jgi:hypothetical protein